MYKKLFIRPVCSKLIRNNTRSIGTEANKFILSNDVGDKGILTINRPDAFNATNVDMLKKLLTTIQKWSDEKSLIIVKGVPGKAFSAGGDLKAVVANKDNPVYGKDLWKTEYVMNHTVASLKIPYIAFIDGVTMGGGAGISVHGKYCIATENTLFAMPESSVGLFPDVGASYFFPRLQGKLGYYIGLTGTRLKGQDVFNAGLATHYCPSVKLPQLERALLDLKNTVDIDNVINKLCSNPSSEFNLSKHLDQINKCFDASSVEEVLCNLEKDNTQWAKQTIKSLRKLCPTSIKITFRNLQLGSELSLGECLQMEYRLALRLIASRNFNEGVQSLLVRKDNNPKWDPSRIEDVTDEEILPLYEPLPNNEELPIDVKLTRSLS